MDNPAPLGNITITPDALSRMSNQTDGKGQTTTYTYDHRSHAEQDAAIGGYIRSRNQRAKPKTSFATRSKIRHPDYPFKVA